MDFRQNVLQLLEDKGISQSELATRMNKSRQNISILLKSNRLPSLKTIQEFAAALEVEPSELIGDNSDPYLQRPDAIAIHKRFFEVFDLLIDNQKLTITGFCKDNEINKSIFLKLKSSPEKFALPVTYLSILTNQYKASADFILNGVGDAFKGEISSKNLKPIPVDSLEVLKKVESTEFRRLGDENYLVVNPLVEMFSDGEYLSNYNNREFVKDLPKHAITVERLHIGEYLSFEISGKAMDDGSKESFFEGMIITGRKIDEKQWRRNLIGNKLKDIVILFEDAIDVARVLEFNAGADKVKIGYLNIDKDRYPDLDLNLKDINMIFAIEEVSQRRN